MTQHETTRDLARRAAGGDRDAFDALIAELSPRVEAYVRSRLGPQVQRVVDAEDVVQETFTKAFEHIERLQWRGEQAFFGWLASIADNIVLGASQKVRRAPLQLDGDVAGDAVSPSRALRREERLARLRSSLDRLSADHREVIVLARIEKLQIREIAARMDRSPNAVKKLLARALEELKQKFGDTESLRLPNRPIVPRGSDSADSRSAPETP